MKSKVSCVLACVTALILTAKCAPATTPPEKNAPAPSAHAIVKALRQADADAWMIRKPVVVPITQWNGNNALQSEFVERFINLPTLTLVRHCGPAGILDAIGGNNAGKINYLFKVHDLSMRVGEFPADNFGMGTYLSTKGKWVNSAPKLNPLELTGVTGKAAAYVSLSDTEFYQVFGRADPIVRIYHDPEISVFVTPWDGADEGFEAVKAAKVLTPVKRTKIHPQNFDHFTMPMIDMELTYELDWLTGMSAGSYRITRNLSHTKIQLAGHGFSIKHGFFVAAAPSPSTRTGTGTGGHSTSSPKIARPSGASADNSAAGTTYVLNRPFLLWVQAGKLAYPVFATKVDIDDWKAPTVDFIVEDSEE
jgi:hypothetical protein